MSIEIRDPRMRAIVAPDAAPETVATGFIFTEGPLWHPQGRYLLFSDMPGDHIRRWSVGQGVTTFRKPSHKTNGLALDNEGRLVCCQHATSTLTRTEADGRITTLASHYQGKELNSPNDVVVHTSGTIYFTDPIYGRVEHYGVPRELELAHRGVYCVRPDGSALTLLADDFGQPNGLCFSADERHLYVNDTERQHIRRFDVRADGTVSGGDVWARTVGDGDGGPDGMKMDSAGNVYSCGPGGVHVFAPDATSLGVIRMPEHTANFAWGEDGYTSLFITASTTLYRIRTKVPGRPQMRHS